MNKDQVIPSILPITFDHGPLTGLLLTNMWGKLNRPQPRENDSSSHQHQTAVIDTPLPKGPSPPVFDIVTFNGATCYHTAIQLMLSRAMSFPKAAPSRALLSHLCRSSFSTPSPCLRSVASRQIRCESAEGKPVSGGRSFKGQLYESTAVRLARERAERERFSKVRKEGSGGRSMALTFGRLLKISSVQFLYSIANLRRLQ
jgi:hypothetical protein